MLKVVEIKPANISDDELAAVMAALAIVTQPQPLIAEQPKRESGWKRAARLEGTGRKPRINSIEQLVTLSVAFVIAIATTLPVGAQGLNTSDVMPPTAPSPNATNPAAVNVVQALAPSTPAGAPQRIRVALQLDTTTSNISLPDGGVVRDATTGDTIAELPPQSQWRIISDAPGGFTRLCFDGTVLNAANTNTKLAITDGAYTPVAYYSNGAAMPPELRALPPSAPPRFALPSQSRSYAIVPSTADGTVAVAGKLFRGALLLQPNAKSKTNGFDVINNLELEDYLLSVVPSEMPSGWPLEALKAQAIAARSYALANLGKHGSDGYDMKATVDDQAYSGVSAEHPESTQAVLETKGLVLEYGGKPISAFFHSCSGGYTELAENVWRRPVPYLKAVADYDDEAPNFAWTRSVNVTAAEQAFAKSGKDIGALLTLTPVMRGVSPRVRYLMASGTNGTFFISGEEARKLFNLPSTAFNVGGAPDSYVFAGRGYGHGLGMSQWGAKKLAESGWTAPDILSYYYKDVTVNQF
jgi:stage II sporulation protein D